MAECEVCGRPTCAVGTYLLRSNNAAAQSECYRLGYERMRRERDGFKAGARAAVDGCNLAMKRAHAAESALAAAQGALREARARFRELGHLEVVNEGESCCDACDRVLAAESGLRHVHDGGLKCSCGAIGPFDAPKAPPALPAELSGKGEQPEPAVRYIRGGDVSVKKRKKRLDEARRAALFGPKKPRAAPPDPSAPPEVAAAEPGEAKKEEGT